LELLRPESAEQAVQALGNSTKALAGGTELVPLIRDGIVTAETLVDLSRVVPRGIHRGTHTSTSTSTSTAATVGAGRTLAELEVDPELPGVLREACRLAASPQLRSMGTVGGNLLQATRCWYWRLRFPCYLHGGDRCHAKDGAHREHAIFGNDRCASAHPSDVAAALLALGATVRTTAREFPVADLYRLPTDDDRDVTALRPDELILELEVPAPAASTYLKAMDRQKWAFPLVGVAAARFGDELRLALAGVAPIPWLIESPEAIDAATPLPGTAYKVQLARALVRRALAAIGAAAR
jgi:xanthine dehydrogenase YagS FAD-binding subunit